MEESEYMLQMKNISKSFPGVNVLKQVSFELKRGEVHALMGENGAGKSTLMKILAGVEKADSGEILFKGRPVQFVRPVDSLRSGISMIYQELNSILDMTVAENIFIGREPCYPLGILNKQRLRTKSRELFKSIGIDINPDRKMSSLSVAEMQMVEIVKAISYQADIIIMDEPTSAITDREVEKLFAIIRKLKSQGKAIVYISHKMEELYQICDRITVMRDGQYIATKTVKEMDKRQLIALMVGRDLKDMYVKEASKLGATYLEAKHLTRKGKFYDISFHLRQGEILGFAGLMGSGRTELVEAAFGASQLDEGEIFVKQKKVRISSPKVAIAHGIALVTEDRKLFGLNLKASVKHNISLANLKRFTRFKQLIRSKAEREAADEQIEALNIKTSSRNTIVGTLSGGNQQKVVLAKWLLNNPDVLILDEPTRGIDVGSKAEIYKIISQLANAGKAILMISSEMPELLGMSDRILVLHEGRITGEFDREEFHQESIMACATGQSRSALETCEFRSGIMQLSNHS